MEPHMSKQVNRQQTKEERRRERREEQKRLEAARLRAARIRRNTIIGSLIAIVLIVRFAFFLHHHVRHAHRLAAVAAKHATELF